MTLSSQNNYRATRSISWGTWDDNLKIYNLICLYDNIIIGPCDNSNSSDPIIVGNKNDQNSKILTITIDTSAVYEPKKVCLKFLRSDNLESKISEPFYFEVSSACSPYFKIN